MFAGPVSSLFCVLLLTSASFLIHLYALWYMAADPFLSKFLCALSLFTGGMNVLFLAEDFLLLFIGWELIGLASLLLISYFNGRIEALKAGVKAIVYNRFGDLAFLLSLVLGLAYFNDSKFSTWFHLASELEPEVVFWLSFPLCLACWAKSAQLGLHPWLLDAMEGPTPVSSLLHSATLVTAGIVLVFKAWPLWMGNASICLLLFVLGFLTSFYASLSGLFFNDSKRLVAFSTCSHVALMLMSLGTIGLLAQSGSGSDFGSFSLLHLFHHGWDKSAIFMLVGFLLHLVHSQDLRSLGLHPMGLPLYFMLMSAALFAIQGAPGSNISVSKDCIIEFSICSINGSTLIAIAWSVFAFGQGYAFAILAQSYTNPKQISIPVQGGSVPFVLCLLFALLFIVVFFDLIFVDFFDVPSLEVAEAGLVLDPFIFIGFSAYFLGILTSSNSFGFHPFWMALSSRLLNRMYFDKFWAHLGFLWSCFIVFRLQSHLELGLFLRLFFLF